MNVGSFALKLDGHDTEERDLAYDGCTVQSCTCNAVVAVIEKEVPVVCEHFFRCAKTFVFEKDLLCGSHTRQERRTPSARR